MSRRLSVALAITDLSFIAYWAVAFAAQVGLIHLPAALMYSGYGEARVTAWNWSFFPLDLGFSLVGLAAVRAARRGEPLWRPLALISLVLTQVAGLMAVGYWALLGEFDPSWFLPNLALVIWPLAFLPRLICDLAAQPEAA
ncbi:DUF5360 family protein [Phenylobacterium aquaticum]|uniref:DUF5360 family protein n=1 Tax=Phenylobacterium aquaticum TaxID=1763816 RepID=UPI001F5DAF4C|nr:DUF5360 family protein [Phenylobacterium aquaticum]MCI3133794.1 YvaD family protein [Phenylobacterium aquaticum]